MMLQGCIRSRRGHWAVVAAILACLPLSITLAGPFDKKKKTVGAAPIRRPAKGSSRVLRAPKNKELAIVRAVFFEANKEQLGSLNLGASSAGQLVVRKSDRWQAQFERVKRKLRILSVPHVAVVAGKPATIFVGQEVPILWLPKTKEVIASIPTGITAKVIATRQKDKKISLDLVLQIALAERTKAKRPRRKQLQTQVVTQRYLRTEAKVTSQTETLVVQLPAARGDKGFIVAAFTTIMLARGQKAVSPFGKTGQTRPATKTQPAKR